MISDACALAGGQLPTLLINYMLHSCITNTHFLVFLPLAQRGPPSLNSQSSTYCEHIHIVSYSCADTICWWLLPSHLAFRSDKTGSQSRRVVIEVRVVVEREVRTVDFTKQGSDLAPRVNCH